MKVTPINNSNHRINNNKQSFGMATNSISNSRNVSFGIQTGDICNPIIVKKYDWKESVKNLTKDGKSFEGKTLTEALKNLFSTVDKDLKEMALEEKKQLNIISSHYKTDDKLIQLFKGFLSHWEAPDFEVVKSKPFTDEDFIKKATDFVNKFGFNPKFNNKTIAIENYIVNDLQIPAPENIFKSILTKFEDFAKTKTILTTVCDWMEKGIVKITKL